MATPTMTDQSKELRQKRAKLIEEMNDLTKDNGKWNSADNGDEAGKRWAKLNTEQEALKVQIEAVERSAALQSEMQTVNAPAQPQPGADTRDNPPAEEEREKKFREKLESKEYRDAFFEYARFGVNEMSRTSRHLLDDTVREARTYTGLNVGTGSQGAYVVPIGFQREIEEKMKAYGRMREHCRIITTATGNTLDWPTVDDTTNTGRWLAEAGAVSQTNPTYGQIQFTANLASSDQVLISVQLLQDSAFDLEAELTQLFGIRLGRLTNLGYTKGSGSGQPNGLITQILADASPNMVNAIGSNTNDGNSDSEATSIGSDDLDNIISAVDPAYRMNGMFMMNWKTIDFLRKLKDKYGRPLWVSSLAVGEPDRIFGYPFDWNADMDAIPSTTGVGANTVLFGDFSKYVIRDVAGFTMVRYNELYMPNHQIGFQAFLRTDGQRLQAAAFSLLHNPLS